MDAELTEKASAVGLQLGLREDCKLFFICAY